MTLTATCATIAAMLASAQGGETITLKGSCPTITIANQFRRQVTIDAVGSRVAGLIITGSNVRWRGGTIRAKAGVYGAGPGTYGVRVYKGATNIRFEGVTITGARKGMVINDARNIVVEDSRFWRIGDDGINAANVTGLTVARSRFHGTIGKPSECLVNGVVTYDVAARNCAGAWTDGWHKDAIQFQMGVVRARIFDNLIEDNTQGIATFSRPPATPNVDIQIYGNIVRTDNFNHITLAENCSRCAIRNNRVERAPRSKKKAIIRPGMASRCGNYAQDERVQDRRC